ncbi:unnamed protein product [Arabidopsis lyrata]|uniref:uncharacterized protein LOC9312364 n=1 Tax=Arabidopsis lyrata subsp. lyrata TaxID=81972 RepID=UPI000A29C88B|nr:uncharacterized protein LOC9312364 [Arabidopsis lyrata subsp. lyrata]CAH8268696.1 unnamed protein product [Arabidopsis lyrata]|eukprot:XP_020882068.1 uncharacterized protein LOC9312364 [Arabidopsis lyrata subsp. lyrata]
MVLSNKKLKQRIRQDLVKSLSVSVAETNPQSQSLKLLLDSSSHKPRLSKREKRRNCETFAREDDGVTENEVGIGGSTEKTDTKIRKKRKRDDTVEVDELEGDEVTKEEEKPQKKKKKKKKKKKRKVNKTPKKAEEGNVEEKVKVEEIQVNNTDNKEEDGVVPKKLYVGGIPYQSTEDEIRSYFRSCGVITKVDCKMRPEDGAFSGIAFITFETEDGAKRALAFDRAAMGDRFLTIQQYVKTTTPFVPRRKTSSGFAPEMVDGYNRVYIGNLAWDTTERDIRKLFSDCVINSVRLGKNKETGEFKGYAHVDFKDSVSVAIALKLDQQVICGRPVKVCCALKDRPAANISTDHTPGETNNVGSYNMEETYAAADPIPALAGADEVNDGNYFTTTVSSGKIKKRVCYECGEKGHLSTACPKKLQNADDQANSKLGQETVDAGPAMQSYALQKNSGDSYYMNETYAATYETNNGYSASAVSTGKIKRRNCFECGEKGHLSNACPKKHQNADDQANSKLGQETVDAGPAMQSYALQKNIGDSYYMNETYAATNETNDGGLASAVSTTGKVKRRNCYECGEKGHLSTACPKKLQNTAHTNSQLEHQTVEAGPVQVTSYSLQTKTRDTENNGGSFMDETYATVPISVDVTNGANDASLTSAVSTGKIKKRNCYECGEKGHLSSACPKKLQKQG